MIKPIFCLFVLGLLTGVSRSPKNSGYPPEIPQATFSQVSYGQHERNVLDFWKAKSKSPILGKEQRDPTQTSNFGIKLQEHCKSKGVDCDLVYPGAPKVRFANPTEFLISKLKKN